MINRNLMININGSLTDDIINEHFNTICRKNDHKRLRNYFDDLLKNPSLCVNQIRAVIFLKNSTFHPKKSIIKADIFTLDRFKIDYEEKFGHYLDRIILLKKNKISLRKYLQEHVFYYKQYDRWNAYNLAKRLNVNTCPYCNRMPTYTIGSSDKKGTRPQFDHFFDKSRYPYLSLSIYNLVPSCNICNSSYKHTKEFNIKDHFHPYLKGFDCENIKFTLEIANIEDLLSVLDKSLKIPEYEIKFKCDSSKKMPHNISDLGLEKLYNYDKSYTNDIIKKSFIYNKDYMESLYKEWEGTLFGSKDEIKNLVMGNYLNIEDINNRPLGKLTKDITEELRIF